jgi:uncharacterized paraquat-inducible protein A
MTIQTRFEYLLEHLREVDRKILIASGAACLLFLGVAVAAFHRPANNVAHPQGTYWTCDNGHSFLMTTSQLSDFYTKHYGERIPCPTCGSKKTVRAYKCPACGTVYPAHEAKKCPNCGAPVPDDQ